MYGTWTKLFVPDAKYRPSSSVGIAVNNDVRIIGTSSFSFSDGAYITNSAYSQTNILTPIPTDDELQSVIKLSSSYTFAITAKTATDIIDIIIDVVGSSTSYAAGLARSCYISGLGYMDLPNIYELMVCWCEADNIDNMDPTVEDYPDLKIGYSNPSGRFRSPDFCSSTIRAIINGEGKVFTWQFYTTDNLVLPVLEL